MRAAALLLLLPLLPLLPAALAAAPPAAKRGTSLEAVAISPSTISVTCSQTYGKFNPIVVTKTINLCSRVSMCTQLLTCGPSQQLPV
jgi:hypothetical protein